MKKFIAKYKQGKMAWINAENFLDAVNKAIALEEEKVEYPEAPERFEKYEIPYFGQKIRETAKYREWRAEKNRIENHNQTCRVGLISVHEFMA